MSCGRGGRCERSFAVISKLMQAIPQHCGAALERHGDVGAQLLGGRCSV